MGRGVQGIGPTNPERRSHVYTPLTRVQAIAQMSSQLAQIPVRFPHPKILLIDVPYGLAESLRQAGHNVSVGSFGVPYRVPMSGEPQPIEVNGAFSYTFSEQDIVVVNLQPAEPLSDPEIKVVPGVERFWTPANHGMIDPRPISMAGKQEVFRRILEHGGFFVVFADTRGEMLVWKGVADRYGQIEITPDAEVLDTWSFLPQLDTSLLTVHPRAGEEMTLHSLSGGTSLEAFIALRQLLAKFLPGAHYRCTFEIDPSAGRQWLPLVENKYHDQVAGILVPGENSDGCILLLPQVAEMQHFLHELFSEILPELVPRLFPHAEKFGWLHQPEYELPVVLQLQQREAIVIEQATQAIADLKQQMEAERQALGFLQAVLTETGDALVQAVKQILELLGFTKVVDVDAERQAKGDTSDRREDLRIEDGPGLLLVEIKGITNTPKEASSLQVTKYLPRRMRDLNRTDIDGLVIVNHQRHLPPLDRQNDQPFSQDVIATAEYLGIGLLTTWDLFRLARSYLSYDWRPEHVKPLFQQSGRIQPIPAHYQAIGVVSKFYAMAQAVEIELTGEVCLGDRIGFEQPIEVLEHQITSLQVGRQAVQSAQSGSAGVQVPFTKEQLRPGTRVFRVVP